LHPNFRVATVVFVSSRIPITFGPGGNAGIYLTRNVSVNTRPSDVQHFRARPRAGGIDRARCNRNNATASALAISFSNTKGAWVAGLETAFTLRPELDHQARVAA